MRDKPVLNKADSSLPLELFLEIRYINCDVIPSEFMKRVVNVEQIEVSSILIEDSLKNLWIKSSVTKQSTKTKSFNTKQSTKTKSFNTKQSTKTKSFNTNNQKRKRNRYKRTNESLHSKPL